MNWKHLINSLHTQPSTIHDVSRSQLLDDSFSLARSGHLSYSVPLGLASYLTREACYFPWAAFIPHVNFILMRLNGHSAFDVFRVSETGNSCTIIIKLFHTVIEKRALCNLYLKYLFKTRKIIILKLSELKILKTPNYFWLNSKTSNFVQSQFVFSWSKRKEWL